MWGLGGLAKSFGIADFYTLCEISRQVSETVRNVIKKEDSTRWFLPFFKTETGIPLPPPPSQASEGFLLVSAMRNAFYIGKWEDCAHCW